MATNGVVILVLELCFAIIIFSSLSVRETEAFSSTYSAKCFSANVTQLLDSLLANYDKRIRPGHGEGSPTTIQVNMNVRSMGPFSEKQESYAMQLYLRQVWYDTRLKFNRVLWGRSEFSMNWMFADKLWKPDTFFINGKNSAFHRITAPNMFIRLRHDGQITWSMRLTVRATCLMHLRKFPLDTQHCPLRLASYGYNSQDIVYRWDPNKLVTVDSDVSIAQYELVSISTGTKKVTIRRKEKISTLSVKFHLRRQTGFFLLQVYVPCILIVCCSWVAFWITKKDVPGRVGLGVNGVLSMTKLSFGGRSDWPEVSYPTALDYWTILCFVFVFGTIVEYAAINFLERYALKRRKKLLDLQAEMEAALKADQERAAKSGGGTMVVTTTIEEGKPVVKDTLRQMLKMPLSVVPSADDEAVIIIPDDPQAGDTKQGYKSLMTVPLTVLPQGTEVLQLESDHAQECSSNDPKEGVRSKAKLTLVTSSIIDIMKAGMSRQSLLESKSKEEKQLFASEKSKFKKGSEEKPHKEKEAKRSAGDKEAKENVPSIIVDVSGGDDDPETPPPPKQVTIWQLLMQKQKLMRTMTPSFIIPAEEDILDKFSVVDLYARRIFPSLFFFFTSLYWILFNYYITDEFPGEKKVPSDGLIVN